MPSPTASLGIGSFLFRFVASLSARRGPALIVLLAIGVEVAFAVLFPVSLQWLIDDAIVPRDHQMLMTILGGLLGGGLLLVIAGLARDTLYSRVGNAFLNEVRGQLFAHLQRLSMSFYTRVSAGDILARFGTDLAAVEYFVVFALPMTLYALLSIGVSLLFMFLIEWQLALLTLVGLGLSTLGPLYLGRRASDASYRWKQEQARLGTFLQEHLGAQGIVKGLDLQEHARRRFGAHLDGLSRVGTEAIFLNFLLERVPNLTIVLSSVGVVCIGGYLATAGVLTVGNLVAFTGLLMSFSHLIGILTWGLPCLVQAATGLRRIDEILNERPHVEDAADASALPRFSRTIAFDNVSFGYQPEQLTVRGATVEIPHGQTVALVGRSGSGKSSFLNLLIRFYDVSGGAVCIDGQDVRQVTQSSLRAQMGIVFQENLLFNLTVRENLRLGRPTATDAEVEEAARAAEIHDFILSLPQGYDTPAGERGGRFSGGQRQRMALARALLRDPRILLLDEATSALDPATENAVNETLRRVAKGRTVVSVTHRLATIVDADRIVVLDQGRVVEQGTHGELLRNNGAYADLWRNQTGFQLSEDGQQCAVTVERLRLLPVFRDLDEEVLAQMTPEFVTESYPAERTVIVEGDRSDKFYVIVRGKVSVSVAAAGTEQLLNVLQDGDYVGEISLLRDVPRTATVRTVTPTVFLTLTKQQFNRLLARAPELRKTLEERYLPTLNYPGNTGLRGQAVAGRAGGRG